MKKIILFLLVVISCQATVEAQILDKIKRRAKQEKSKSEDEVVDKLFKKNKKGQKNKKGDKDEEGMNPETSEPKKQEMYMQRYDFKPGKEIIFFDDFESDEVGEIPRKWHYNKGLMEIVQVDGEHQKTMSGDLGYGRPNWKEGYTLPEAYTIEFDLFIPDPNAENKGYGSFSYHMYFYDKDMKRKLATLFFGPGSISVRGKVSGKVPGVTHVDLANSWNHISISVNGNSMKAYFNDYRMFNTRLDPAAKPVLFTLWNCCQTSDKPVFLIDNFKVAAGAHPKYKQEILEGKIVTNNIHFESGSSTIIPRSYAEIKRVAEVMKLYPSKNFSVQGHTDNEGSDQGNLLLSEQRAAAVMKALVEMGIDSSRLSAKGFGESAAIATNESPEGRATNRRVEFVLL